MIYEVWDIPSSTLLIQTEDIASAKQVARVMLLESQEKWLDDVCIAVYNDEQDNKPAIFEGKSGFEEFVDTW